MLDEFLKIMSISVTEMFRDPEFYRRSDTCFSIAENLSVYQDLACGCATGEEVYSMGFCSMKRVFSTGTDLCDRFHKHRWNCVERGLFAKQMTVYADNYRLAGARVTFPIIQRRVESPSSRFLERRITFSYHKPGDRRRLWGDDIILLSQRPIYFDKTLQDQVLRNSQKAFATAGSCASATGVAQFSAIRSSFGAVDKMQRIYQKMWI